MRRFGKACAAIALAMVLTVPPAAAGKGACLRWADIDTITRSGPDTVRVTSRRRGTFEITFTGRCDYQRSPGNYFIVRLLDRWECVGSLHVLEVHEAGACFIKSVHPVQ